MPIPLDEVLVGFKFDSDGRFVGQATSLSVVQQIAEAVRVPDYSRLSAPTLAVYALADHWTTDYASFTATERARFAHAVPSARVEAIPHSKHYLFLTNRAEVVREVGSFIAGLQLSSDGVRSE